MANREPKQAGFTIVELLIVIIVIAILAAISVMAYQGIQARARNQQTISTVNAYYKAFVQYAIEHGSYPAETSKYCLSDTSICSGAGVNTAANNLIRPYFNNVSSLPAPSPNCLVYMAGTRCGAQYEYISNATLDSLSNPWPWGFSYILEGYVGCGVDHAAGMQGGQFWPNFSSTPGPTETERSSGNGWCRVILPDPKTL